MARGGAFAIHLDKMGAIQGGAGPLLDTSEAACFEAGMRDGNSHIRHNSAAGCWAGKGGGRFSGGRQSGS